MEYIKGFTMNENFFNNSSKDIEWLKYSAAEAAEKIAKENTEKYLEFKERISKFDTITTLNEAKELSKLILPVANDYNKFKVGNAICIIINKSDLFRVSLNSETEFISYDFV